MQTVDLRWLSAKQTPLPPTAAVSPFHTNHSLRWGQDPQPQDSQPEDLSDRLMLSGKDAQKAVQNALRAPLLNADGTLRLNAAETLLITPKTIRKETLSTLNVAEWQTVTQQALKLARPTTTQGGASRLELYQDLQEHYKTLLEKRTESKSLFGGLGIVSGLITGLNPAIGSTAILIAFGNAMLFERLGARNNTLRQAGNIIARTAQETRQNLSIEKIGLEWDLEKAQDLQQSLGQWELNARRKGENVDETFVTPELVNTVLQATESRFYASLQPHLDHLNAALPEPVQQHLQHEVGMAILAKNPAQ
ncbi:MAG: hypothetical protein SFZ03_08055 [Candidatus Melainabacteria bacterium]|nr:hypothetical protein [Candidatus Melainabacteria bacterium]